MDLASQGQVLWSFEAEKCPDHGVTWLSISPEASPVDEIRRRY